ncbi:hypothetical protein FJZ53_01645 [Candidatus Woesearchaeota archaeon]|nr:hypothetical protein [Candidatus Woesearchaeota archaeon]
MMGKKSKIEMETLGKILLLTAFLIIFLLMFKGCKDQMENVGVVGLNEYVCWMSKALQADFSFLFPSACHEIDMTKEPQGKQQISILMRKCWWMYGQGEKDLIYESKSRSVIRDNVVGKTADKIIDKLSWADVPQICYMFTPKEDMELADFKAYLKKYDRSGELTKDEDTKETTWGYIQKSPSEKSGICFDDRLKGKMLKGKIYYVMFYDDRGFLSKGTRDRIFITRDANFGEDQAGFLAWAKEIFSSDGCEDYGKIAAREAAKAGAKTFFSKTVEILQRCMKTSGDKPCVCDDSSLDPLNELPTSYSVEFKKVSEKTYKVSLLDAEGKVYVENGKEFSNTIDGNRLGNWGERELSRKIERTMPKCLPGEITADYKITKYLKDYRVIYHPNNEFPKCFISGQEHDPKTEDFAIMYLIQQDTTGFPKCSELPAQLAKEQELALKEQQRALCKSYDQTACYANSVKCFPYVIQNADLTGYVFSSCESCEYGFKCSQLMSEETCKLNPCSTACKWIPGSPIPKGRCENG